jgi:hypothetical protein
MLTEGGQGGFMRSSLRCGVVAAILLVVAAAEGCSSITSGTSVTYSYDPTFSFADSKTYAWVKPQAISGSNALLETNVRFVADHDLQARGLSLAADNPALLAWIGYDPDYYGSSYTYYGGGTYDLRVLTLNIARAADKQLVWQGRARGSIKTDASSGELKNAVDEMLANFPPKSK